MGTLDEPAHARPTLDGAARRPRKWLRRIGGSIAVLILIAITVVIAGEAVAWLWPQDFSTPPDKWMGRGYRFAFFARVFQFHAAVGVLLTSAILLCLRWRRSACAAALCGVVLLVPYAREYVPKPKPSIAGPTLRVMEMNLYFRNTDIDAMMRAITDADPDVIVMPEATDFTGRELIYGRLGATYKYVDRPFADGAAVVVSRVPFTRGKPLVSSMNGSPHELLIFNLGGRPIAFYGVHLVSPGADWLIRRNRRQTEEIALIRHAEPMPVVVAGDFNFSQLTPNYRFLREQGFRSSADLAGFGLGNSWGPKWSWLNAFPGVRIDHILMTPELTAVTHRVGLDDGSDHRPVIADIGFSAAPTR